MDNFQPVRARTFPRAISAWLRLNIGNVRNVFQSIKFGLEVSGKLGGVFYVYTVFEISYEYVVLETSRENTPEVSLSRRSVREIADSL